MQITEVREVLLDYMKVEERRLLVKDVTSEVAATPQPWNDCGVRLSALLFILHNAHPSEMFQVRGGDLLTFIRAYLLVTDPHWGKDSASDFTTVLLRQFMEDTYGA